MNHHSRKWRWVAGLAVGSTVVVAVTAVVTFKVFGDVWKAQDELREARGEFY